jgi:hypothetical protein
MELKKNKNECKKCGHVYGLCSCDPCECNDPKNQGEECLSCQ